jgi:RND superfamily putative drug exporter
MLVAVGVLFVLLVVGLRAPIAALAVTAFGAVTALAGFGVMALLGKVVDTDAIAVALAAMTGLALGVGFSLLMLDRFHQEEFAHGGAPERAAQAAATAVATTGRAILFSGTALIVALVLATAIAPTPILTSLGIGVLLCSALATGAAVVVMPALLTILGHRMAAYAFPAPPFLASGWDWLVGRGRWLTRWALATGAVATAALLALAVPAASLDTGPPDVSMLPASNTARQSFERVASVMGPGWPTPYNIVVVSTRRPLTSRALLRDLRDYQRRLARDPRVDSVVGPGAFVATSRDLKALPAGLEDSAKLLKGGKKELGKLARGLGQAGAGAAQLKSGLGSAAQGAGKLQAGSGSAGAGAGKLRGGLDRARSGADRISAGLSSALDGARSLKDGAAQALAGSQKVTGGLGQAVTPVKRGLPVFNQLAADVKATSGTVTAARGAAEASLAQLDAALGALGAMTAGKEDPRYAEARQAMEAARESASGASGALATADPKLQSAAGISAAAAGQVGELSNGLSRLYAGSTELTGGIAKLRDGNAKLAGGIARLDSGGGQLNSGLVALRDGAAALETGLAQLTGGAGTLQSGLAGGTGPAGQLAGGLDVAEAKVSKFRGSLPSPKELEELQEQSPGLFKSGYFVLAAIEGAPPADRNAASFVVNLPRGGNAGQIVVVPAAAASSPATRQLGEDLKASTGRLARATGTRVAVGGPAGDLADFTSETNARLPLVIVALALTVALVLSIALRAVALPAVVVAFDLLTAAATFGAMSLLFGGEDPVLGGPGYLDPMSIIGIFSAIFGISVVFQVLLLARARERFVETGDAREALLHGLRGTAAMATGAGAVMVAAVLPFAFSDLLNVRQFGVGVAVAVALDALLVRPVLLPAAAALLGERSWWPTRGNSAPKTAPTLPLIPPTPGAAS